MTPEPSKFTCGEALSAVDYSSLCLNYSTLTLKW